VTANSIPASTDQRPWCWFHMSVTNADRRPAETGQQCSSVYGTTWAVDSWSAAEISSFHPCLGNGLSPAETSSFGMGTLQVLEIFSPPIISAANCTQC